MAKAKNYSNFTEVVGNVAVIYQNPSEKNFGEMRFRLINHRSFEKKDGTKGTEAYQLAQSIKKALHLSNVVQVVHKYMDEEGKIKLPTASPQPSQNGEEEQTGGGGNTNPTPSPSTGGDDNGDKPNL